LTEQLVAADAVGSVAVPGVVPLAMALLARSAVKLTVPVGAVAEPGVASVTVAVQLLGLPTGTRAGEQLTSVLVSCLRAVTTKVRSEERRVGTQWKPPGMVWRPTAGGV